MCSVLSTARTYTGFAVNRRPKSEWRERKRGRASDRAVITMRLTGVEWSEVYYEEVTHMGLAERQ